MRTIDDLRSRIIEVTGMKNVYTRPPSRLKYPCMLISLSNKYFLHADNIKYRTNNRYSLQIISEDDTDKIVDEILELPYTTYDRNYISDSLNHTNLTIYF